MEPILPSSPYTGRPAGSAMLRLPDGHSAFKIYFVDIPGRKNPERFEWDRCGRARETVAEQLQQVGVEGVGFVLAFPHITKIFRFGPNPEILLHVRAYRTSDFEPIPLERAEGYYEFACLAEAIVAAEEYRYWASARTVEEYLEQRYDWPESPVLSADKLRRYYHGV